MITVTWLPFGNPFLRERVLKFSAYFLLCFPSEVLSSDYWVMECHLNPIKYLLTHSRPLEKKKKKKKTATEVSPRGKAFSSSRSGFKNIQQTAFTTSRIVELIHFVFPR